MTVIENKEIARTVTVVSTHLVKVSFKDPLFPKETLVFSKKVVVKDGGVRSLGVYNYLDRRYRRKIGEGWKTTNITDAGKYTHMEEVAARRAVVVARNDKVIRASKKVEAAIRALLTKGDK